MSWFITSSNFTIWGQIGLLKNAWTWPRSLTLDGNAFPMLQHERMRARLCHCGLKQMPCFMTCNTVTNLGTLDTVHFIRGRPKHRKPQLCFSQPGPPSSRWRRHTAHRVVKHRCLTRGTKALWSGTGRHAKTLIKRHELASPRSPHLEE